MAQSQAQSKAAKPIEWHLCAADVAYFVDNYVYLLNATDEIWRPFKLWPAQREVFTQMQDHRQLIVLKARQLGLTWCCLAFALWRIIFYPIATIGIFSRREEDAQELLDTRLKGMYERLPDWMHGGPVVENNKTRWQVANGSTAMAFATNGGRQYTFSLAMVDEADFQPDLPKLLAAVEPTIDAGGRMWLISSANKDLPESRFKTVYRVAKRDGNIWHPIFLPWSARPGRTPEWYEQQKGKCLAETGALDEIAAEYPATPEEALAPRQLDKRIPSAWLSAVYTDLRGTNPLGIPGLTVFVEPQQYADPIRKLGKATYRIGCDPAEGNPSSDDSAATVVSEATGEEMAVLCGKLQPSAFAAYVARLAEWYNGASVLVERNNHGHAVLLWLADNSTATVLNGPDERPGWPTTSKSKAIMYSDFVDQVRDKELSIHCFESYLQLASIDGSTLSAPDGMHDDRAVSFVLATLSAQLLAPQKRAGTW